MRLTPPRSRTRPSTDSQKNDELWHGRLELPATTITSYSLEVEDPSRGGHLGDRVRQAAFHDLLQAWRARFKDMGADPFARSGRKGPSLQQLDDELARGGPGAAVLRAAVEDYAIQFVDVVRRLLRQKGWRGMERIVIGGGFQQSDVGRLAVGRAGELLARDRVGVYLRTLHHDPDEGGLVGWVQVIPSAWLQGRDALLAVDIGGTNVRCGIVRAHRRLAPDFSAAEVVESDKWAHAHDADVTRREDLVDGIAEMLGRLIAIARRRRIALAPFVGVSCPGLVCPDGSIAGGAQNLPGNWESQHFHMPSRLESRLPAWRGESFKVLMHNDAVVQGLSELPYMTDVRRWAVLTIGTGLGNASFANR
ncbi:ROK family protein [Xylophilus sp. GOD-11R]|uniref:ROK family protein n=1 Tax=Xylophilus sp. GOD-11R TaxID=3089814 RepID=UPI00298CC00B|nr:ROK family protein [Xylophilus sp. GOD-11R]WPB55976.1 ROK family protein [Xylophilus sp. GOD-11R]